MLALTKKTEYALIALTLLARSEGRWVSARDFRTLQRALASVDEHPQDADATRTDPVYPRPRGGYVLALNPPDITIEKIILAVEGPVCLTQCIAEPDGASRGSCEVIGGCPVKTEVRSINEKLRALLGQVTLAQLAENPSLADGPEPLVAEA